MKKDTKSASNMNINDINFEIQETPNPNVMMYSFVCDITNSNSTYMFEKASNLSHKDNWCRTFVSNIFSINGVISLMIKRSALIVTKKADDFDWDDINPNMIRVLSDASLGANILMLDEQQIQDSYQKTTAKEREEHIEHTDGSLIREFSDLEKRIIGIIDDKIKPFVEEDGGHVELKKVENNIVYIEMTGACSGCPYSEVTLKSGIENTIKYYVPEIEAVEMYEE